MPTGECRNRIVCTVFVEGTVNATYEGHFVGDLNGDFNGTIIGSFKGTINGDFNGTLIGKFDGTITGDFNGTIIGDFDGSILGDFNGTIDGDFSGEIDGTINGEVTGDFEGTVNGDFDGTVNIDLNGSVSGTFTGTVNGSFNGTLNGTFNGTIDGVPYNGPINGPVNGVIVGTFTGTITGTVDGVLNGTVDGTINGTVDGTVNGNFNGTVDGTLDNGTIDGIVNGHVNGNVDGSVDGTVNGNVNGDFDGSVDGDLQNGNVNGNFNGTVDGNFNGNINGPFNGDINGPFNGIINGNFNGNVDGLPTDPENPFNNDSAEGPDVIDPGFDDIIYPNNGDPPYVPPPYEDSGPPGSPPGDVPTDTGEPPPIVLFSNSDQTCTKVCGGQTIEFVTIAGLFSATTQAESNSLAMAHACEQLDIICEAGGGSLPTTYQNTPQSVSVSCDGGGSQSYTAIANLFSSTISLEDANASAYQFAVTQASNLCNGVPATTFTSTEQTCEVTCANGTKISYTAPAGSGSGVTQAAADAAAMTFACSMANALCTISNQNTFSNTPQTCTPTCGSEFTAVAGLFSASSQADADSLAMDFACEVANALCPTTTPDQAIPPGGNAPPGDPPNNNPPTIPPPTTPPTVTFSNSAQTCSIPCGDGGTFKHAIAAGIYFGSSAAAANAMALSACASEGFAQRFCLNETELNFCHNTFVSATLSLEGTLTNATWVVTGLPPGLTLTDSGTDGRSKIISGTPSTIGQYTVLFTITDTPSGNVLTKSLPVYIMGITNTSLPEGYIDVAYDRTVETTGFVAPLSIEITNGNLPAGLVLNQSTGNIAGTPTESGSFNLTFRVTDDLDNQCSKALTLTINPPAEITTASPLPEGSVGTPYSTTLAATGVVSPLTWEVIAGSLPDGLTLNASTGVISGTPTTADP